MEALTKRTSSVRPSSTGRRESNQEMRTSAYTNQLTEITSILIRKDIRRSPFNPNTQCLDALEEYLHNRKIHSILNLKLRLPQEDYQGLLSGLEVCQFAEGATIIQRGNHHPYNYFVLLGNLSSKGHLEEKHQSTTENTQNTYYTYSRGELLFTNLLPHKFNPFTITAETPSICLRFNEETYLRHIKKTHAKQIQENSLLLTNHMVFAGIKMDQIKKLFPYFSELTYDYNSYIFRSQDSKCNAYVILNGEVQVSRGNSIKLVTLCKGQLFGIEGKDSVKVVSSELRVIVIQNEILEWMKTIYPQLEQNLEMYFDRILTNHNRILKRNIKISKIKGDYEKRKNQVQMISPDALKVVKKKRKRRNKRKIEQSLEWWGLAEKFVAPKKYALAQQPLPAYKPQLIPCEKGSIPNIIDQFKRRLLEEDLIDIEEDKQNEQSPYRVEYAPKLQRIKLRVYELKPKVMNNAKKIKQKLVSYAKSKEAYVDQLQLI